MNKKYPLISLCTVMALSLTTNIQAKDGLTTLEGIVVSEEKKEKELLKIPFDISVITAEEISERGHKNVPELLKSVPGLHASVDSEGTHFFVRGQQVAGGEGIMLYIDGRKAIYSGSSTTGVTQGHKLDNLPIEMIDRIEVIKSPAASIYGAGASHGIINIYTKKAKKGDKSFYGSVTASLGTWNTYKTNISVYGKKDKIDYGATLSVDQTDGYREIDKGTLLGEVSVGYSINDENHIGIKFGADKTDRLYPVNFKDLNDLREHRDSPRVYFPEQAGRGGTTPAGYQDPTEAESTLIYGGLNYNGKIKDIDITSNLNISNIEEDWFEPGEVYDDGSTGDDETDDRTNDIIGFDLKFTKNLYNKDAIRDTIIVGTDYEYFKYDNKNNLSKSTTVETITKRYGIFANNNFSYDKFSLLAGLRFDSMDWELENGNLDAYDNSYEKTSWDIAPSYSVSDNMNLFYSLSKSFWFPNAFHLSMPSWFGAKDNHATPEGQVPEENLNQELGVKHIISENFNYNVTFFHIKTKDKYIATYDAPITQSGGFTGYKPAGDATSEGIEISFDGKFSDFFAYRGSMTYTDITWDAGTTTGPTKTDISGKKLEDVPEKSYSAGVTFFPMSAMSVAIDMNHDSEAYANNQNTVKYASYTTFDARVNYESSSDLSFYLLSSNILDKEHYKENSGGMAGTTYDPRDGRYIEVGFTKKF